LNVVEEGGFIDLFEEKTAPVERSREWSGEDLVPQAEIIYEPDAGPCFLLQMGILSDSH
jgi:hypothetical protein